MRTSRFLSSIAACAVLGLAGCASSVSLAPVVESTEAAPAAVACPQGIPEGTRCLGGKDSMGASYLIAMPADWNGTLVLHAHGGPSLGAPTMARPMEDLQRWSITVRAGYAWAGSSFRQGGVAVHAAAEDTERLRGIFRQHVAKPKFTILHGQSWGGSVAAVEGSLFTEVNGQRPYDAVLLTSGLLGGGSRSYDFRIDLRVIYQALCRNHPLPSETPYPLWQGLPPGVAMTRAQLDARIDDCLALNKKADQRTPDQQRKVLAITRTLKLPESSIKSHMEWATFAFADVAQKRTGGANVFGNLGARYTGSGDDDTLNREVQRYATDPAAVARFAQDTDPDGRIPVPVLTVHAIDDPTAFVELESAFRDTMQRAGTADHLVQTFTNHHTHSYLSDPVYPTLMEALTAWAKGGPKPTPQAIAERCKAFEATYKEACGFVTGYAPQPLATRITPRDK